MQQSYTNHNRITNQHNKVVWNQNLSQVPKHMRDEFFETLRIQHIADDLIQMFDKYYTKIVWNYNINDYHMAEHVIKKIQNLWIETLYYTNQLDPLYELCITNHIDQKIKDFDEFPNNSSYKVIEHTIHKAKESWIDVQQYESLLPTLQQEGLLWTLHQKLKACIINDSINNILWLRSYIKELIRLWIFISHTSLKKDLDCIDLQLYTPEQKDWILGNIDKHASIYQATQDLNELDMVLEEIFLAEQLWIDIDTLSLARTLWLPIEDEASQERYVNSLLDLLQQEVIQPTLAKEEKKRIISIITLLS